MRVCQFRHFGSNFFILHRNRIRVKEELSLMRLGIIGLPQCGKTTLFNAVTRGTQPTGAVTGKIEIHDAVVK